MDGNGRTSRLLCALYLYKSDYDFKKLFSISEYYDKDRRSFYQAIQSVRKNNMNMTSWLEYFIKGFLYQMREVMKQGEKIILKDTLIQDHRLSKRQAVILEYILENEKLFPKDFEQLVLKMSKVGKHKKDSVKITIRTLQRDLKDMMNKQIIRTQGATHKMFYILKKHY